MKIKPEKIFLILCSLGVFGGVILLVLGIALKSHHVQKIGAICFLVGTAISFVPLLGFILFVKLPKLFRRKSPEKTSR